MPSDPLFAQVPLKNTGLRLPESPFLCKKECLCVTEAFG